MNILIQQRQKAAAIAVATQPLLLADRRAIGMQQLCTLQQPILKVDLKTCTARLSMLT